MTRTLVASTCLGLALMVLGCVEPRRYRYDRYDRYDRVEADREDRLDINRASQRQLERLPGLSEQDAGRIIANRPYSHPEALVRRGVIGARKYDRIEDYVYASRPRHDRRDDDARRRYDDDYEHRRYYDDRR